jgi:hypothetical protein
MDTAAAALCRRVQGCPPLFIAQRENMKKNIRLLALIYLLMVVSFAWGYAVMAFHVFPFDIIQPIIYNVTVFFTKSHKGTVKDIILYDHQEQKNEFSFSGFRVVDTNFHDDGYLLISRYSKEHSQPIIELFDIPSKEVIFTWIPDIDKIFEMAPTYVGQGYNTKMAYCAQHPFLMENGDLLITNCSGPIVRINRCGNPLWAIDRKFHHSIEIDVNGNIIIAVSIGRNATDEYGIRQNLDGIVVISPSGSIIKEYQIRDILMNNGYEGLIYGVGRFELERYHLNDAQPFPGKPESYGLLLSMRNLSSVALFRPQTGKIAWLKTGPWLNQHDINYIGNGEYSIFSNNWVRGIDTILSGHSEIYLFNPSTGQIKKPFSKILDSLKVNTREQGRTKILNNGDAFIEETFRDRILRISPHSVRWEYVNGITENTTGALHWTRYLERGSINLDWLKEDISCN